MNDHPTDCDRFDEPIALLAAGCLPAGERDAVRRHVERCSACAARHDDLARLCGALRAGRPDAAAPAAAIRGRLVGARDRVHRRSPSRGTAPWSIGAGGIAAAALVAALVLVLTRFRSSPRSVDPPATGATAADAMALPWRPVPGALHRAPTLHDCEAAFADSDAAFETLLCREGQLPLLEPYDPRTLFEELHR